MVNHAHRRNLKVAQQKRLEAALIHELGAAAKDCCDLLDRANAALKSTLAPRQNRDEEIRRKTLEELSTLYGFQAWDLH